MRTKFFIIIFFSCIHCSIKGQVLLSGSIYDENKEVLALATVALYAKNDTSFVKACISDTLGRYKIDLESGEYLIKFSLIGYVKHTESLTVKSQSISKNIILKSDVQKIAEVIITASRNPFTLGKDGLMVNVQNSFLKNEPRITDLLAKIPGIISIGNGLEVFGKGVPTYYINGKEVSDFSEVENLAVDDIQSIQLLTSPSARYSSDMRAVLLIKTKKRDDGLYLQQNANGSFGRGFSHNEGLNAHYQRQDLHFFGMYKYSDVNTKESGSSLRTTKADTIWTLAKNEVIKASSIVHFVQAGFDYDINKKQELGLKYTGKISNNTTDKTSSTSVNADNMWAASLGVCNHTPFDYQNHHVNMYYTTSLNDMYTLNWYSDYIHKETKQHGTINETDSEIGQSQVSYQARSLWNVWASNIQLAYNTISLGRFTLGYKMSYVKGNNRIQNVRVLKNGKTENQEDKHSLFLMYEKSFGSLSLNAGLRYEYLHSKLKNQYSGTDSPQKSYSDVFPSISLSHSIKEMQHSLSYTSNISRPEFSWLNNNVTYVNRFDHQKGNIHLLPSMIHDINYSLFYKFIYFNAGYNHTKNLMFTSFYAEPNNSSVMVGYVENFKRVDYLTGVVNLRHDFKWWTPSIALYCIKYFFNYESNDGTTMKSKLPITTVFLSNSIKLPKDLLASVNYTYCFGGDLMNIDTGSYSSLDLKLQRNFLKKKLSVYLEAYDVFDTNKIKAKNRLNNISLDINTNYDQRKFGLSVIYRFNIQTKRYKGNTAAQDELDRLSID